MENFYLFLFALSCIGAPVLAIVGLIMLRMKPGKSKWYFLGSGIFVVLFCISLSLHGEGKVPEPTEPTTTQEDVDALEKEALAKTEELDAIETKIKENQESYDAAMAVVKDGETKKKEIETLDTQINAKKEEVKKIDAAIQTEKDKKDAELKEFAASIDTKKDKKEGELKDLENQIKDKKGELASITGAIQEKKDAPIILPAGTFTVGKDLPEGRYKAVPNGGNGNFFINDGADANIILGKGEYYEPELVFDGYEGDEIKMTTSVKFIPVN